jgi:hypothetical protein
VSQVGTRRRVTTTNVDGQGALFTLRLRPTVAATPPASPAQEPPDTVVPVPARAPSPRRLRAVGPVEEGS